jgi:dTDP-4-dehydrorhamnose 3,5-epimerase
MIFLPTPIPGARIVRMNKISDHRGYFARGWCTEEFRAQGLNPAMVQLNVGQSRRQGTLRGLHYQTAPHAEAKYVRCVRGGIYDVIVDLRPDSPTCGQWFGLELSEDNGTMLYVPEGCAHGYQTLGDEAEMYYLTTAPYVAKAARGVRYNDHAFDIAWPLPVTAISEADAAWPDFMLPSAVVTPAGATHL